MQSPTRPSSNSRALAAIFSRNFGFIALLALAGCGSGAASGVSGVVGDSAQAATSSQGQSGPTVMGNEVSAASAQSLASGGRLTLKDTGNKCLGAAANGTTLGLYACEGLGTQAWTASSGTLVHSSGLCLDVAGGKSISAAKIVLAACNGNATQKWTLSSKGIVQGNLCLDVKDFVQTEGTPIQLWPCTQTSNQMWRTVAVDAVSPPAQAFVTTPDLKQALSAVTLNTGTNAAQALGQSDVTLTLDTSKTYQSITGFGASLTDSSSQLLAQGLSAADTKAAMARMFDPKTGIGISLLRQPMGASDFSSVGNFSYNDAQNDVMMSQFSLGQDLKNTVPLLQMAVKMQPDLFIMGTPWSPPAWMKNNNSMYGAPTAGGSSTFKEGMQAAYSQYFVKFVQAYAALGIHMAAVTPQNEPLNDGTLPSMYIDANAEANLVAQMGPAFKAAGLDTSIWAYDHNWDRIDYPQTMLADGNAGQYIGAAAFHCYGGDPTAMTAFHKANPNTPVQMTECSDGAWHTDSFADMTNLIIDSTNNWSSSVVFWALALDPTGGPMNKGCNNCVGVVTVDPAKKSITYGIDYYIMGHASRFVRPKAVRVGNSLSNGNVKAATFKNADGSLVAIVYNTSGRSQNVAIVAPKGPASLTIPSGGVATVMLPGS